MEREIRFRVWDNVNKKMIEANYDGFDSWRIFGDSSCALLNNRGVSIFPEQSDPFSPHVLMQFTGLLDKNKKEIYEGDIVRHCVSNCPGVVLFDFGSFVVDYKTPGIINDTFRSIFKMNNESLEIIGNLYLNPELFEGNK